MMRKKHNNKGIMIREYVQRILNIGSPVASSLSLINPALLAIPIIASVNNELCSYFDSRSIENRLREFQQVLDKQAISIDSLQEKIDQLDEHAKYVFRNDLKHLCLAALPETTESLIHGMIAYLMEENQDMNEEICEILCSCNANDICLLQMIKGYLSKGSRAHYQEMIVKAQDDIIEKKAQQYDVRKEYKPKKWYDRNIIHGKNTIFWSDFASFFGLVDVTDMGEILNTVLVNEDGEKVYDWYFLIRSLLKLQSKGEIGRAHV